jgi:orotate phosphoribosyltransferase
MGYKEEFIEFMLESEVLTFGDFVTKSGRKTPFFINTGKYKTGEQISRLGAFYAECINENMKGKFDVLYGPAYKGIPLAVSAGIALFKNHGINANYCFNRKEEKDHGEGGSLIGYAPKNGDRIILVEDVITAGTSVRESVRILKNHADVDIVGLIISVIFWAMLLGGQTVAIRLGYSPFISIWLPNILALTIGFVLFIVRIRK